MSAGWLAADASPDSVIEGHAIDRAKFPTRFEEYTWALQQLGKVSPGVVIDAGCGFNPEIHILSYALHDRGWYVLAADSDTRHMQMPSANRIVRHYVDICHLWPLLGTECDAWVCISTLEHMDHADQLRTIQAAYGCLRSGGLALMTADLSSPQHLNALLRYAGFETGPVEPLQGMQLTPRVAWAVGRKP